MSDGAATRLLPSGSMFCGLMLTAVTLILAGCDQEPQSMKQFKEPNDSQWAVTKRKINDTQVMSINGFKGPYGITVTNSGILYVPDIRDGRVLRFSDQLKFEKWLGYSSEFSSSGWFGSSVVPDTSSAESLQGAHSIDFDSRGNIYVADFYGKKVNIYDNSGKFSAVISKYGGKRALPLEGPAHVYVDAEDNVWISDWSAHRVYKLDAELTLIGWLGATRDGPGDGFSSTGDTIRSDSLGGFDKPHTVQIDAAGNIYVVETGNHRVQKFDSQGLPQGWLGVNTSGAVTNGFTTVGKSAPSAAPGGFNQPVSLFLNEDNQLIVADNGNNRIQLFNLKGHFIGWLGATSEAVHTRWTSSNKLAVEGTGIGYFSAPFNAVQRGNRIYVADGHNNRVQVYINQ